MARKHTYNTKHGLITKTLSASQAIRAKCLDCSGWQENEVRLCGAVNCPLWVFRMGRPLRDGEKLGYFEEN